MHGLFGGPGPRPSGPIRLDGPDEMLENADIGQSKCALKYALTADNIIPGSALIQMQLY